MVATMPSRPLLTAELLSIGSELTVGETRDTNAGELARSLTGLGIRVLGIRALPDDLDAVRDGFAAALERADLVVSTGGLGPTPDDLTREAVAAVAGETPSVDPGLEEWLRGLWARRGMPFPEMNLKQAWRIPSATALPNPNGTAPGWWVERPDGRLVVTLPGPPREMRPMWHDAVLPRLAERGAGTSSVVRTFRLAGIGESQAADLLGEPLLRASDPQVATYARADAVDVRISSSGEGADERVAVAADTVRQVLGRHIWAEGETSWPAAIGAELVARRWTLGVVELGTGGSFATLVGDVPWLRLALAADPRAPAVHEATNARGFEALVTRTAAEAGSDVGLGIRIRARGEDTAVSIVVISPAGVRHARRIAFLGGANGRFRAALVAADVLLTTLRAHPRPEASGTATARAGRRRSGRC